MNRLHENIDRFAGPLANLPKPRGKSVEDFEEPQQAKEAVQTARTEAEKNCKSRHHFSLENL